MNLKFLSIINEERGEGHHLLLIDIGTCGLYTIQGSLKNGIISSGWKIDGVLRWMWNLLKESPARREIYKEITNGNVYPLSYCNTTWCENKQTTERAAEIWPKCSKFVEHLMVLPKPIQPKNNKSYTGLITVVIDPLVCANLKLAEMLLWKFIKFLRGFQTDNPIVRVLYFTLEGLLRWLLEKLILKETLAKFDSAAKLLKINPKDVNIQKPTDQVDRGSAAKLQIAEYKKVAYKESKVYTFCREITVFVCNNKFSHFMEKVSIEKSCCSICGMF